MIKTVFSVDGMACSMCEAHVNDAIRKAAGKVKKVTSSTSKGIARSSPRSRWTRPRCVRRWRTSATGSPGWRAGPTRRRNCFPSEKSNLSGGPDRPAGNIEKISGGIYHEDL